MRCKVTQFLSNPDRKESFFKEICQNYDNLGIFRPLYREKHLRKWDFIRIFAPEESETIC
jgi:hypothetical protein